MALWGLKVLLIFAMVPMVLMAYDTKSNVANDDKYGEQNINSAVCGQFVCVPDIRPELRYIKNPDLNENDKRMAYDTKLNVANDDKYGEKNINSGICDKFVCVPDIRPELRSKSQIQNPDEQGESYKKTQFSNAGINGDEVHQKPVNKKRESYIRILSNRNNRYPLFYKIEY